VAKTIGSLLFLTAGGPRLRPAFEPEKPKALFIGRYQPFHAGHQRLIEEGLRRVGQVCIAVRDTHRIDDKNPLPFFAVKQRIETALSAYAGRFVCKKILGSALWSQHSWGNADDLFPTPGDTQAKLRHIADAVVYQATHKTIANRGRRLKVAEVIDHDAGRRWTPQGGWGLYTGATGAHVHVSWAPFRTGTPACA